VIAWHADRVPGGRGATPVFAVGLAGPLATSPLIGAIAEDAGARSVPWVLAGLALTTTAGAAVLVVRSAGSAG
jgi:hypothetical protein